MDDFADATDLFATELILDDFTDDSPRRALDQLWTLIQQGIMQSAKKYLPKSTFKNSVKDPKPEYLVNALFHLKSVSHYIRKFSIKHINAGTYPSAHDWSDHIFKDLLAASHYLKLNDFELNESFINNDPKIIRRHIIKVFG